MQYNPATESDGPSGTLALARALVLLGKKVMAARGFLRPLYFPRYHAAHLATIMPQVILTVEECNMQVMQATCKAAANACPSMASGCTLVEYSTNANGKRDGQSIVNGVIAQSHCWSL